MAPLAFPGSVFQPSPDMTKPMALLLHEKLMPGSQLVSRFEERDYRVATVSDPGQLAAAALQHQPMLVVADLTSRRGDVLAAIRDLRATEATLHVPVLAYTLHEDEKVRDAATQAGVTVLATDATIIPHLDHFIEHALRLD